LKENSLNIQDDIFNLIGFEEFDFIEKLVTHRKLILSSLDSPNSNYQMNNSIEKSKNKFISLDEMSLCLDKMLSKKDDSIHFPNVYCEKVDSFFGQKLALPIGTDHINNEVSFYNVLTILILILRFLRNFLFHSKPKIIQKLET
jgi:hypothetical protein